MERLRERDRAGGALRLHGADHRRDRRRQGAGGASSPRRLGAPRRAADLRQLRRPAGDAGGERAVRARPRRVHRRDRRPPGQVRGGRRRHAAARRDRRAAADGAAQAAARAPGGRDPAGRLRPAAHRSTCAWSPPPTATWRRRCAPGAFAPTCSTASTCTRCTSRRCAQRPDDIRAAGRLLLRSRAAAARPRPGAPRAPRRSTPCAPTPWPGNVRELDNVAVACRAQGRGRGRRAGRPS